MKEFSLRYAGVLISGFCIGLGRDMHPNVIILTIVSTVAIMVSHFYYYEKGLKKEEL